MKFGWRLKKIDRMMVLAFLPPFLLSFFIALFVLTMQIFWLYIDEILGKGIGFFQLMELIGYLTISFVPMAFPIAVLLASVLVFGNLGERYELSSMKSAGISLLRIMRPLMIVATLIAIISFFASNYLIPKANLKFFTRLYDIRKQKPALALESGIFNDDFGGYSIYIGKKGSDERSIEDIIIYDQLSGRNELIFCTRAEKGQMYTTKEGNRFVLDLENGIQLEEPSARYLAGGRRTYPLIRTSFKRYTKSFDLDEFTTNATDESRFSDNQKMLTNNQIAIELDSLEKTIIESKKKIASGILKMFTKDTFNRSDTLVRVVDDRPLSAIFLDSLNKAKGFITRMGNPVFVSRTDTIQSFLVEKINANHFYELLTPIKANKLIHDTRTSANLIQSEITNVIFSVESTHKKEILFWQQFYQKYSFALVCILFLFVGGPMGAIVRKGGFGYPFLISIIFFVVYLMSHRLFEKLTDTLVLPVAQGAWMATGIIALVGIYLTRRASRDVSSNFIEQISTWFKKKMTRKPKHFYHLF